MGLYDDDPSYVPPDPNAKRVVEQVRFGDGYRVQVPSTWGVEQDDIGERMVTQPAPGSVTCVEIVTKALGYAVSMERYAAGHIEELREAIPGVNIDERAFTRLADHDAYRIDFSFTRGGESLRAWRVLAMERNVAYRITYVAPRAQFEEHDAVAREILASLELVLVR
jgi:hypothetical protein